MWSGIITVTPSTRRTYIWGFLLEIGERTLYPGFLKLLKITAQGIATTRSPPECNCLDCHGHLPKHLWHWPLALCTNFYLFHTPKLGFGVAVEEISTRRTSQVRSFNFQTQSEDVVWFDRDIHSKLCDINLLNVAPSLISRNPTERLISVEISLFVIKFLPPYIMCFDIEKTTNEFNLNVCTHHVVIIAMLTLYHSRMWHPTLILFYYIFMLALQNSLISHAFWLLQAWYYGV